MEPGQSLRVVSSDLDGALLDNDGWVVHAGAVGDDRLLLRAEAQGHRLARSGGNVHPREIDEAHLRRGRCRVRLLDVQLDDLVRVHAALYPQPPEIRRAQPDAFNGLDVSQGSERTVLATVTEEPMVEQGSAEVVFRLKAL